MSILHNNIVGEADDDPSCPTLTMYGQTLVYYRCDASSAFVQDYDEWDFSGNQRTVNWECGGENVEVLRTLSYVIHCKEQSMEVYRASDSENPDSRTCQLRLEASSAQVLLDSHVADVIAVCCKEWIKLIDLKMKETWQLDRSDTFFTDSLQKHALALSRGRICLRNSDEVALYDIRRRRLLWRQKADQIDAPEIDLNMNWREWCTVSFSGPHVSHTQDLSNCITDHVLQPCSGTETISDNMRQSNRSPIERDTALF